MRMIDEDEVGLKEKPEDNRYIKKVLLLIEPDSWYHSKYITWIKYNNINI